MLTHFVGTWQADFEPNSRKLSGHERVPDINESQVSTPCAHACGVGSS